jgi:hypothetical protein
MIVKQLKEPFKCCAFVGNAIQNHPPPATRRVVKMEPIGHPIQKIWRHSNHILNAMIALCHSISTQKVPETRQRIFPKIKHWLLADQFQ